MRHSNAAPQQYRSCGGLLQEDFLGSHTFFCPIAVKWVNAAAIRYLGAVGICVHKTEV